MNTIASFASPSIEKVRLYNPNTMNISYFVLPLKKAVLVVIDPDKNYSQVIKHEGSGGSHLSRTASMDEVSYYKKSGECAWIYYDFDQLLEEEELTGSSHQHLGAILKVCLTALASDLPLPLSA